ncbi:co-chaperone DjlA [Colwellia sp. M166]|jgi:DnaJ like chaperone protein|uniref:co-chaperone DjlA n=1 Tax=Colwellia sp. M166 TaxID=2583805 RepID=UPI00211DC7A0|nr:co-chaperone DjlA [Colwellia sp. M166]UUO24441.1 co-chaperone DjlA [Colwellia sp. M166]|tara:strand:+ start:175 stop:984 length:810 start_codon:yes stop_codon:yes gene_type:complete
MRIWGKILGFLFGFMLSKNIIGALLGAWIGHRFDKGIGLDFSGLGGAKTDTERQAAFFYSTFSVMGYIAKANGQVTQHEIAFATAYMDKLGLRGELRQQAQEAFRDGKTTGFPLEERLAKLKSAVANRQDLLLLFLEIQIQVAFADGNLDKDEREALHQIANGLGYSAKELDKLLEMIIAGANFHQQGQTGGSNSFAQSGQQLANAYKVLGVTEQDSASDIKKAYRKLMSQHHPDKLVAKGLPPEMMEMAKQKAQDIQAAYELITAQNK